MQTFEDAEWTDVNFIRHYIPIHILCVFYGRNIMYLCMLNDYKYLNIIIYLLLLTYPFFIVHNISLVIVGNNSLF